MRYSTSGSAKLGSDYMLSGAPGEIVIPAGESSGSIALHSSVTGPQKKNKKKTAGLVLQSSAGYKVAKPKKATVTIAP